MKDEQSGEFEKLVLYIIVMPFNYADKSVRVSGIALGGGMQ